MFRCATTIMNLLSMANEKAVPAADDFIPVLIFVIIKANPPCLLSTIQYVQSFYGNRIGGEEQYWWIQFCSAAEFIKTMEYIIRLATKTARRETTNRISISTVDGQIHININVANRFTHSNRNTVAEQSQ